MSQLLLVVTAVVLGLQAGALLAEGALLLPIWRSLPAEEFQDWYRTNGDRLVRFFGPLEVAAAVLAAASFGWSLTTDDGSSACFAAAAVGAILVILAFPAYFKNGNARFTAADTDLATLGQELERWGRWHWGRTAIAIAATVAACLGL